MKAHALLALLFLAPAAYAQKSKEKLQPLDKYVMPVLDSKEVVSKVSVVNLGAGSTEKLMRQLHSAVKAKEPVAIDDQNQDAPVWMFGAPVAGTKVKSSAGDLALRIEFLAADGSKHERLNDVVNASHLVIVTAKGDMPKEQVEEALTHIRGQMRPTRVDQIALWIDGESKQTYSVPVLGSSKSGAGAMLGAIVRTIKSGKTPSP